MESNKTYNFNINELKSLIGGDHYKVNKYITIYIPHIYEIIDFGEDQYFNILNIFTRKPYDMAVELFDSGIDYQSINEWDLFFNIATKIPIELSCILFGKLNFQDFTLHVNEENGLKCLVNKFNNDFRIDEVIYKKIISYLRYSHFISEKVEYDVGNNAAKKFLIERMRRKQKKLLKDYQLGKIKKQSQISNMIKYCISNRIFQYNSNTIKNMKLDVLYDFFYLTIYNKERDNLMFGVYSGTIDTTKMKDKSILNVIPDLHK